MFVLYVGPELDLGLNPGKLAGLVERHRVGAIQDVVPGLEEEKQTSKESNRLFDDLQMH